MWKAVVAGLVAGGLGSAPAGAGSEVYGDRALPVAGTALGLEIRTKDAEELRFVIVRRLTDRYARDQGIAVRREDKDAYVRQRQDFMKRDRERHEAVRDDLARRLAAGGLSAAEREPLSARLESENQFLRLLDEMTRDAAADPDGTRAARDQVAGAFILQWKVNRALYGQYGGRIAYQQGGPEPVDAYRRFLEERQARGDFVIRDKALEAAFWRYYSDDAKHSFYPPGSPEEAAAFASPPWLSPASPAR